MSQFRIYLSPPHLSGKELPLVQEAFASNWIAPLGPHVDGFERELSDYVGTNEAAALSSGTAAIHLALLALGVKPGDKVICSSFTFAGSANPIVYCGADPVFVDSEPDSWNMCPNLLEQALSTLQKEGTPAKAVILVELYGVPAQMERVLKLCKHYGVPLIEDAAEALGSSYKGQRLGSFGDVGILSFNGNKIITTSGGGALLSNDAALVKRTRFLSTQARDPAPHYEHSEIGFNYRMSNILAALGRGQLAAIEQRVVKRRQIFAAYRSLLSKLSTIEFPSELPGHFPNRWLTTVLLPNAHARDSVMHALLEKRIESRPLWKPMHQQKVFSKYRSFLSGVSERLFERGLCLPSGTQLSEQEIEEITHLVATAF